jgi:hypothetical protein
MLVGDEVVATSLIEIANLALSDCIDDGCFYDPMDVQRAEDNHLDIQGGSTIPPTGFGIDPHLTNPLTKMILTEKIDA